MFVVRCAGVGASVCFHDTELSTSFSAVQKPAFSIIRRVKWVQCSKPHSRSSFKLSSTPRRTFPTGTIASGRKLLLSASFPATLQTPSSNDPTCFKWHRRATSKEGEWIWSMQKLTINKRITDNISGVTYALQEKYGCQICSWGSALK